MVNPKEARTSAAADNAVVHVKNTINVEMEDLNDDDRKAVEQELEREMAELQRRNWRVFRRRAVASSRRPTWHLHPELR
jgi:predicted phosphoribosyltransferase